MKNEEVNGEEGKGKKVTWGNEEKHVEKNGIEGKSKKEGKESNETTNGSKDGKDKKIKVSKTNKEEDGTKSEKVKSESEKETKSSKVENQEEKKKVNEENGNGNEKEKEKEKEKDKSLKTRSSIKKKTTIIRKKTVSKSREGRIQEESDSASSSQEVIFSHRLGGEKKSSSASDIKPITREELIHVNQRPASFPTDRIRNQDAKTSSVVEVGKINVSINHIQGVLEVIVGRVEQLDEKLVCSDEAENQLKPPNTYAKAFLFPELSSGSVFRSQVQKQTFHPNFESSPFQFKSSLEDIKKRVLHITLWKYDSTSGNELIGELSINLSSIYDGATMDDLLTLLKVPNKKGDDVYVVEEKSPKPQKKAISTRTDHVSLSTIPDQPIIGEIKMTLDHDPEGKTLKIIILNANVNLPEEIEETQSIYLKLQLSPDPKKATKKKTKGLNEAFPMVFNETFMYRLEDLEKKNHVKFEHLEISIILKSAVVKFTYKKEVVGHLVVPLKDVFGSGYLSGFFPVFKKAT